MEIFLWMFIRGLFVLCHRMLDCMSQDIIVHIFRYVRLIDLERLMIVKKHFLSIICKQSVIVSRRSRYLETMRRICLYCVKRRIYEEEEYDRVCRIMNRAQKKGIFFLFAPQKLEEYLIE